MRHDGLRCFGSILESDSRGQSSILWGPTKPITKGGSEMAEGEHTSHEISLLKADLAETRKLFKELVSHHGTLKWNTFWTAIGALSGVGAIILALVLIAFY